MRNNRIGGSVYQTWHKPDSTGQFDTGVISYESFTPGCPRRAGAYY